MARLRPKNHFATLPISTMKVRAELGREVAVAVNWSQGCLEAFRAASNLYHSKKDMAPKWRPWLAEPRAAFVAYKLITAINA